MSKILITGASGFIGRHLASRLNAENDVIAMGRSSAEGPWSNFCAYDIAEGSAPPKEAFDGVDTVYHLASKAHALSEQPGAKDGYHEVIVRGTESIVRAAEQSGVRCLVYLSSVKAMGEGGGDLLQEQPISEKEPLAPSSPYGEAKRLAEELVKKSSIPHVVILRPVMVYGPGHKGNLVRMAEAIRSHRFPPIRENGNCRSMLHVDDLVEACLAAASTDEANREAFIVAGSRSYSTRRLYDQLRVEMGMKPIKWHVPSCALSTAAKVGDLLGRLLRKRMPIDSDTLAKLIGSAWYDNAKSRRVLDLSYQNEDRPLLEE